MMRGVHKESMDIDNPKENNGSTCGQKENGLNLYPVSVNDFGEGLPYAPEDWPNPGDKWCWKVGRRIAVSGYFLDRYLYLPSRLRQAKHGRGFASRLSLEQYIRTKFPDVNVDAFFASFSWRIPSMAFKKDDKEMFRYLGENAKHLGSDSGIGEIHCKAGNRVCSSLAAGKDSVLEVMFCDICCSEPGFCRDCCCILCCKTINKAHGGYSYIRCEANIEGYICGHNCHIDCALRAYMAGTVGGSIGLEAEYYCRRCDSRTDLISHVSKLLQTCESIDSRNDIEKILNIGICVLRGSNKTSAEQLLNNIEMAMIKLKNGTNLEDIWKMEDISTFAAGIGGLSSKAYGVSGFPKHDQLQDCAMGSAQPVSSKFDSRVESLKLEDEIDHILIALRKSQEIEYSLAEERLSFQKNYILNLYRQLDKERFELSRHRSSKDQDSALDAVLCRVNQIKQELSTLKDIEEVAKGFGRVPKRILKDQFGLDIEH